MGLRQILCFLAVLLATSTLSHAKHLVGGSLTYEYVGQTSWGDPQYRLKLRMYRIPTAPFDPEVTIGVYKDDGTHTRVKTVDINYAGEQQLSFPDITEDCGFSPDLDFRVTTYETITSLPAGDQGYHLVFVRCCRNNLLNLELNMGQVYYTSIPPTSQVQENSSPQFADTPVPYVCVGDTININYGTNDPDGDSLVYEIVDPYDGADSGLPKPGPPFTLDPNIETVDFANGYSAQQPFGANGIAQINATSGLATFHIPKQGQYAMAVEIREYRNGELLGRTRRDLQFIAINCPDNDAPEQTDTSERVYRIQEGDTLQFPLKFRDEDTMTLNYSGQVFNGSNAIDSPYAQIGSVNGENEIITTEFYWPTTCGQGRGQPYFANVRVEDDGCPPKENLTRYTIHVEEFEGVQSIRGPDSFCLSDPVSGYKAVLPEEDFEHEVFWDVEGGNIIAQPAKDSILVQWEKEEVRLKAWSMNENHCVGDTARLNLSLSDPSKVTVNPDTTICHGDSVELGKSPENVPENAEYLWLDSTHIDEPATSNPVFSGTNFDLTPKTYPIKVKINYQNCTFIDTTKVTVNPQPQISSLDGQEHVCHDEAYPYTTAPSGADAYHWEVSGGHLNDTVTKTPQLPVRWADPDTGKVKVRHRNQYGCFSDSIVQPIQIQNPVIDTIFGPTVVCPNVSRIHYQVDSQPGSQYHWRANNATLTASNGMASNYANYGDSGSASIKVFEETSLGCFSDTFVLPVAISYHLETSPIMGDTAVCEFKEHQYAVEAVNGSTYDWFPQGEEQMAGNGEHEIDVKWGASGNGEIKVLETSYDSVNDKECRGDTVRQLITINPNPETSEIQGPSSLCQEESAIYHVSGFQNSTFHWEVEDLANVAWRRGDSIKIRADSVGTCRISVYELTNDSCKGTLKTKAIEVLPKPDSQAIIGPEYLCIPNESRHRFKYPGPASSTYEWYPENGSVIANNNDGREVHTEWNNGGNAQIGVLETNEEGCKGDTVTKPLFVDEYKLEITHVTTQKEDESVIDVYGRIETQDSSRKTALLRKLPRRNWYFVDSVRAGTLIYSDFQPDPSEDFHDYQIQGLDACGNEHKHPKHRTIHLGGSKTENNNLTLHWNQYKGWGDKLEGYEVYRKLDEAETFELIETVGTADTSLTLDADTNGYRQCYRVKGINQQGEAVYSWSNTACFYYESQIFVPNAFTPTNSRPINDAFRPKGYNVQTFNMKIYNRWGEKVFESNSLKDGWDGTYNGNPAPQGTYLVVITHRGATEEKTYKGTITLLK